MLLTKYFGNNKKDSKVTQSHEPLIDEYKPIEPKIRQVSEKILEETCKHSNKSRMSTRNLAIMMIAFVLLGSAVTIIIKIQDQ